MIEVQRCDPEEFGVKFLEERKPGPAAAKNVGGWENASGDLIGELDSSTH